MDNYQNHPINTAVSLVVGHATRDEDLRYAIRELKTVLRKRQATRAAKKRGNRIFSGSLSERFI